MATNTVNTILRPEDYGDIYVDPVDIFAKTRDDEIQKADFEEDDDYDWIELKESYCKGKEDEVKRTGHFTKHREAVLSRS